MSIDVTRLEIYKLVRHPMTWGIFACGVGFLSLLFYRLCLDHIQVVQHALYDRHSHASLSLEVIKPLCSWTIMLLAILIPLLTTQSFSQEYRQKTFYLWAMSPNSATSIVLGKTFSIAIFMLLLLTTMLLMISCLSLETPLVWPMVASSVFIVALTGCCFITFDLFISSLISTPLAAIGVSFLGNILWMLLEWLDPFPTIVFFLAKELSLLSHSYHALNGIIYSPDIIYYLLFIGFWFIMTQHIVTQKMKRLI